MFGTIFRNVARPLLERLGTMIAVYLIALGLDSDVVAQFINAAMALLFVAFDLFVSRVGRESDITRFINEASRYDNVYGLRREDD